MTYIGTKIPNEQAQVYMDRAFLYLKRITLNRITAHENDNDIVIAISAVAEVLHEHTTRGAVASENNDGYSVSFRDADMYAEAYKTALEYLPPEMMNRSMIVAGDCLC